MKYGISPDDLVDKVSDLGDRIDDINEFAGCIPDFLEQQEAPESLITEAALVVEELLHAIAITDIKLRLIRAKAREL